MTLENGEIRYRFPKSTHYLFEGIGHRESTCREVYPLSLIHRVVKLFGFGIVLSVVIGVHKRILGK